MLLMPRGQAQSAPPVPFTLPNGLRVVVRERHASPLVAIDLWVRAGAREERPDEIGSAHFLEHTLFKGTRTRGPGEADIEIENMGGSLNAATGPDAVHFMTTVTSDHLSSALMLLADVVRNATLPDAEVERERGVILDELAEHDADPSAHLLDLLYAAAFDAHPYRRSPGGTAGTIRARGRDTLAAFYHRTYAPERCVLALVGDLTPEQAHAEALRVFGDWNPGAQAQNEDVTISRLPFNAEGREFPGRRNETEPELTAPRHLRAYGATPQSRVGIAFRAPAAADATLACAAQVTAVLLGAGGLGGRLAAVTDASSEAVARYTPRLDPSLFILTAVIPAGSAAPTTDRFAATETALLSALNSLQTMPPTPAELAAARRVVLGRARFDRETDAGLARDIGYAEIVGGDTPELFQRRVQHLTVTDIEQFVQRYLDPARRVTVILLPAPTSGDAP
jgi:predicted Zn-dependent peptidase